MSPFNSMINRIFMVLLSEEYLRRSKRHPHPRDSHKKKHNMTPNKTKRKAAEEGETNVPKHTAEKPRK